MFTPDEIRTKMQGATEVSTEFMKQIYQERLLQIWVPKKYGGLGLRLHQGLKILYDWAKIDGSLGWMLTLCSGANFFSRNLKPTIAKELFSNSTTCFGGSGMIGGTAERQCDGTFLINGLWSFATGAPHLSHFTLNAKLTENGKPLLNENGEEIIRSFVIPQKDAKVIQDWKSMGMKATGTYSFEVKEVKVQADFSFVYDEFFTEDALDSIPFRIFADLTLMVNYLGMAHHFSEEALQIRPQLNLEIFEELVGKAFHKIINFAEEVEAILESFQVISSEKQAEIHHFCETELEKLSHYILDIYFQLGVKATHTDSSIYQVFCDYFTATQHSNFRKIL